MKAMSLYSGLLFVSGQSGMPAVLDSSFNASADDTVYAVAVQTNDQKILIGGAFSAINGASHFTIARLNTDGTTDTGFSASSEGVNAIVVQPDQKILIGGTFTDVNGTERQHIARLNADGSLDTGFANGLTVNGFVLAIALQSDGRVVIGGTFTAINGVTRSRIARLHANGSLDETYFPTGTDGPVYAVAVHPADGTTNAGKIYLGGDFQSVGAQRLRVARLMPNAGLDFSFGTTSSGANGTVKALGIYSHFGTPKILIGGAFTQVDSQSRSKVARLDVTGLLDTSWGWGSTIDNTVNTLAVNPTLFSFTIGGAFQSVEGFTRRGVARLSLNQATVDTWNLGSGAGGAVPVVEALAFQNDGKVVIGGSFTSFDGQARNRIARLNVND